MQNLHESSLCTRRMCEENADVLVEYVGALPLKLVFEQLWVVVGADCNQGRARKEVNPMTTEAGWWQR